MEQYVEVAIYRLKSGILTERFLQTAVAIEAEFQKVEGFLRREVFACEDGRWLDLVYYANRQAAESAEDILSAAPSMQNVMAMLEIDEGNFFHVTPVLLPSN